MLVIFQILFVTECSPLVDLPLKNYLVVSIHSVMILNDHSQIWCLIIQDIQLSKRSIADIAIFILLQNISKIICRSMRQRQTTMCQDSGITTKKKRVRQLTNHWFHLAVSKERVQALLYYYKNTTFSLVIYSTSQSHVSRYNWVESTSNKYFGEKNRPGEATRHFYERGLLRQYQWFDNAGARNFTVLTHYAYIIHVLYCNQMINDGVRAIIPNQSGAACTRMNEGETPRIYILLKRVCGHEAVMRVQILAD
ncbi:Hypothetical_protein [Hexamita inflata]|uniref:Hypothetical_protein n=1 Tax=Hexamita inflata TaxID=28002 RepID=A0AA86P135_9EUKA|nr:Hypothetical protein HINF_LOCUS16149 [Hexamita inflata]